MLEAHVIFLKQMKANSRCALYKSSEINYACFGGVMTNIRLDSMGINRVTLPILSSTRQRTQVNGHYFAMNGRAIRITATTGLGGRRTFAGRALHEETMKTCP